MSYAGRSTSSPSLDLEDDDADKQSQTQVSTDQERDPLVENSSRIIDWLNTGPQTLADQERDPLMERSWLRDRGARISRWIDDPNEPLCPIPQHSLTFEQVYQNSRLTEMEPTLPPSIQPGLENIPGPSQDGANGRFFSSSFSDRSIWSGMTGPNFIILENITRDRSEASQPQISEISLALYTRDSPAEDLRYIFVTMVINNQTMHYVEQDLYDFCPPEMCWEPQTWEHGTREYEELLGTRIGRTVGYIMLGAFVRGSHRIARILTWSTGDSWDFRFDIEPVSSSG